VASKRELNVEFKGDSSDLVRAANDSGDALHGLGKAASGPGGFLSKLTPTIDPISLVANGLQAVASFGMDAAAAASADAKSAAALAGVLRNVTKATDAQVQATDEWLGKLSMAVGIADDELRPAMARLVAATGDVSVAQKDLQLALDIAAGTGKDFNAVADAMVKAANGNTGAFGRLGLATKDASGAQLTANQILDAAQQKYGGLAEKVADQDPLNKATIAWDEFQETIGRFVLPVLQKVTDIFIEKILPILVGFAGWVRENWPIVRDNLTGPLQAMKKALDDMGRALDVLFGGDGSGGKFNAATIATAFLKAQVTQLAAELRFLAFILSGMAAAIQIASGWFSYLARVITEQVVGAVSWLQRAFGDLMEVAETVAKKIQQAFQTAFDWIKRAWNATLGGLSFHIPGTDIGFDIPEIHAGPQAAGGSMGSAGGIVINMPSGSDGHAVVAALRTYGARVGGLDLAVQATR
jgi:hypothetical protein